MATAAVNIVYPIQGGTYPRMDPAAGSLSSAYVALSFSATIGGGPHIATWFADQQSLGEARFFEEISVQQVWKLTGGTHEFRVEVRQPGTAGTLLASDAVGFAVGS